jgi:hypothetical protein
LKSLKNPCKPDESCWETPENAYRIAETTVKKNIVKIINKGLNSRKIEWLPVKFEKQGL